MRIIHRNQQTPPNQHEHATGKPLNVFQVFSSGACHGRYAVCCVMRNMLHLTGDQVVSA